MKAMHGNGPHHIEWGLCTLVWMPLILLAFPSGARAWMWCVPTAVMGAALAGWRVRKDRGGRQPSASTASATSHSQGPTKPAGSPRCATPEDPPRREKRSEKARRRARKRKRRRRRPAPTGDAKRGRGQRSPPSRSAQKREGCGRGSDTGGMCGGRSEGSLTLT